MNFKIDYNEAISGFQLIKDGEYEVVINRCFENSTPGGSMFIDFDLVIRNDFNQEYQNKHVFHKIWQTKATGEYNSRSLNTIAKACKMTDGKTYNDITDLLNDFVGKFAKVTIKVEKSEYNGKEYENENVKFWSESVTGTCNHILSNKDSITKLKGVDLPF